MASLANLWGLLGPDDYDQTAAVLGGLPGYEGVTGDILRRGEIARPPVGPEASLESYRPVPVDYLRDAIRSGLSAAGASPGYAGGVAQRAGEVAPWTPLGLLSSAYDAGSQGAAGNYGSAALAALGAIPVVGGEARAGVRAARELTGALAPAADAVRGQTSRELQAMARAELTKEEKAALADIRARYPSIDRAAKFLTPQELRVLASNRNAPDSLAKMLEVIPSASEFASYAKMGAPKRGWYRASTQALIDVFGPEDAPRFAALLAATSPQTSVESNLLNTLNIWKNWNAAGRPKDPKAIKAVMGASVQGNKGEDSVLDAWVNNSMRALQADDPLKVVLSGPKVDSFFRNLADDVYRVTNDAWIANATGVNQDLLRQSPTELQLAAGNPGYSPTYLALNARQREGGQLAGMLPSETQETVWSLAMPLMEGQARHDLPAREILQRGLLTPDVIAGTPDFATLLANPDLPYRQILERGGYDLTSLRSHFVPTALPELTIADQRNIEGLAKRLEGLRETRGRESRSYVSGWAPGERVMSYSPFEMTPGEGTGIAEGLISAPYGERVAFTGRGNSAFRDERGHDTLTGALFPDQTVATRTMTGSYTAPSGNVEVNPGAVAPVELPVVGKGAKARLRAQDEQRLRSVAALRGGMTGQNGIAYMAQMPDEAGLNLTYPLDKKLSEGQMRGLLDDPAGGDLTWVDTGGGAVGLNFGGAQPAREDARRLGGLLGVEDPVRTRSLQNPDTSYVDLSGAWRQGEGSGAVAGAVVDELGKLSPADFRRLDAPARQAAGKLAAVYQGMAKRGMTVRPDFLNMLDIIQRGGLEGLRKAVGEKGFLPAIAALGLGPYLLPSGSEEGG